MDSMSSYRMNLSSCFANKIDDGPRLPFATRTTSRSAPKVYASKFISTYQFLWHADRSCCRDKVNRVAGRPRHFGRGTRTGALPAYRQVGFLHAIWTVSSLHQTLFHLSGLCPPSLELRRSKQKRMPTLTPLATARGRLTATQLNRRAVSGKHWQAARS